MSQQMCQMVIEHFEKNFQKEPEDLQPSSFWDESMIMLSSESLPFDLELYCSWFEHCDRTWNGWYFHAPTRVFRKPQDTYFLIAQRGNQWLVYDVKSGQISTRVKGIESKTYESLIDFFCKGITFNAV